MRNLHSCLHTQLVQVIAIFLLRALVGFPWVSLRLSMALCLLKDPPLPMTFPLLYHSPVLSFTVILLSCRLHNQAPTWESSNGQGCGSTATCLCLNPNSVCLVVTLRMSLASLCLSFLICRASIDMIYLAELLRRLNELIGARCL